MDDQAENRPRWTYYIPLILLVWFGVGVLGAYYLPDLTIPKEATADGKELVGMFNQLKEIIWVFGRWVVAMFLVVNIIIYWPDDWEKSQSEGVIVGGNSSDKELMVKLREFKRDNVTFLAPVGQRKGAGIPFENVVDVDWVKVSTAITASDILEKINPLTYQELTLAKEVLADKEGDLKAGTVYKIWDSVSKTLDHHLDDDNPMEELKELEKLCSQTVTKVWDRILSQNH